VIVSSLGTRIDLLAVGERARRATLLGLLVATVVAAVNVATDDTILISTLVAAPLVTAALGGPRPTAFVYAYTLALALALGVVHDHFLTTEHLGRLFTVTIGGALAVWIASLRASHEEDSVRLGIQYFMARTLSEARTLDEVAPKMLETIAGPTGWHAAALWEPDEQAGGLRARSIWMRDGLGGQAFSRRTDELVLQPGQGMPGKAWQAQEPVWEADVTTAENSPRADAAAEAGLHGAVAVAARTTRGPAAVIELFSSDLRAPDPAVSELLEALAAQVGEFLETVQAQEAVRVSEARKAAVLDSALDCVITIDHAGTVVEFNRAAERTFGYSAEEAAGREVAELIVPPSLRERHRASLRRNAETGESTILGRPVELTGMRADGTEFPVEVAVNRIAGSQPAMYTATLRDIAERQRAQEEREELLRLEQLARRDAMRARDQLDAILSGIADAVTAQAPDGTLLFANEAAVRTLGFETADELMQAGPGRVRERFDILDEDGRPLPVERLPGRVAFATGEPAEELVRFRIRATGEERWSVVKATPILDASGAVTMAINVIEDITSHKRAEVQQRFLSEASRLLASSLDPDETIAQIAELAVPQIADWVAVDIRGSGGGLERVALAHADPALVEKAEQLRRLYPPDPKSGFGVQRVMDRGEPELYSEIPPKLLEQAAVDERHLELIEEFGLRSAMAVPMLTRDEVVGVLSLAAGPSGRRFDEQDLELAEELARRCAVALDNARLYSEHAYIARTLQESLLPVELPEIPGVEAAARFRPTGEGNDVGGDFYDIFETGARGWTVVVGDVCGKGPDAAAVTALARYTLRAAAMRERLPSRSLRILNEALLRQRDDRRFCTVAYAYLEAHDGGARMGFASGGHPLPLVLRRDGAVEPLGVHGTLLGVVPNPAFEDRSVALEPGDAVVFYTDGVTDPPGAGAGVGEEGLMRVVAASAGLSADQIASRIEAAALEEQPDGPRDDIAVVVLRVTS
jgi:PAS domain S-box-containing protein